MKIKLHYGRSRYAPHPYTLTSAHRYQSTLEFDLRLQEYIELARARKTEEAIAYTKKHMIQWQETHLSQIRAASALLAFPPETTCGPYKVSIDATSRSWLIIWNINYLSRSASTTLYAGQLSSHLSDSPSTRCIPFRPNPFSISPCTPASQPSNFPFVTLTADQSRNSPQPRQLAHRSPRATETLPHCPNLQLGRPGTTSTVRFAICSPSDSSRSKCRGVTTSIRRSCAREWARSRTQIIRRWRFLRMATFTRER